VESVLWKNAETSPYQLQETGTRVKCGVDMLWLMVSGYRPWSSLL